MRIFGLFKGIYDNIWSYSTYFLLSSNNLDEVLKCLFISSNSGELIDSELKLDNSSISSLTVSFIAINLFVNYLFKEALTLLIYFGSFFVWFSTSSYFSCLTSLPTWIILDKILLCFLVNLSYSFLYMSVNEESI